MQHKNNNESIQMVFLKILSNKFEKRFITLVPKKKFEKESENRSARYNVHQCQADSV